MSFNQKKKKKEKWNSDSRYLSFDFFPTNPQWKNCIPASFDGFI